ncbi:MAG: hypothetical protein ACKOPS_27395, partial [Cyanobium sp.]
ILPLPALAVRGGLAGQPGLAIPPGWWAEVFSRRWEAPLNLQLLAQGLALAFGAPPAATKKEVGPGCDRNRYAVAQSRARSLGFGLRHSGAAPETSPQAQQASP